MSFARRREPEWMDDPQLDGEQHRHALAGLQRINRWSGSGRVLGRAVLRLAAEHSSGRELRVLDLACGGGDVAVQVAQRVRRCGYPIHVTGCDISPVAVATARQRAADAGETAVSFQQLDVLRAPLPTGFDVVMCSLFLHHLDAPEAIAVLQRMREAAGSWVLVDDLLRSRFGFCLAWLGCRLLTRSPVVHRDGPLSVRGAWTVDEARQMAEAAGLQNASIHTHWPQRYLLQWSRPA